MKILAVTGHRPNKIVIGNINAYNKEVLDKLVLFARTALITENPDIVITGMALGWDQAIAQACINQKIPYKAYIPFKGQESVWPKSSQIVYNQLLKSAIKVVVCCDGKYSSDKMQIRNEMMVDDADCVMALWDGSRGGTGNCVEYADFKDKKIVNVWNNWIKFSSSIL